MQSIDARSAAMRAEKARPFSPLGATAVLLTAGSAFGQITSDPFAFPITPSAFDIVLRDFAMIPDSEGMRPRMNDMKPTFDGTSRMLLVDQRGPMYNISADGSRVTLYLNIKDYVDRLSASFEGGLQSVAVHPEFEINGKFYTLHGAFDLPDPATIGFPVGTTFQQILLEWTQPNPNSDTYNGAAPREILRLDQNSNSHYGGGMTFDYNAEPGDENYGLLFFATGDGASAGDPDNLAQNGLSASGKLFRIDPLEGPMGEPYTVPASNPYLSDPTVLDEAYAIGFRNPQRISFDPAGILAEPILTDIGQGVIEEVNRILPGRNYGWRTREGSFRYNDGGSVEITPTPAGFTDPVVEYDHSEGNAVTGGYMVRTDLLPELADAYLFGDIRSGKLYYVPDWADVSEGSGQSPIRELLLRDTDDDRTSLLEQIQESVDTPRADLRFGIGQDERIFLLNKRDGMIRTIGPEVQLEPCNSADLAIPFLVLNITDVQTFLIGFGQQLEIADLVQDNMFNIADVQSFLISFGEGCPD